jgi:hypothetical protein
LKLKPPTALRKYRVRGLVVAGVLVAGVGSLVLQTTPALADPEFTFVAVGSDTIQDVYNQFASDLGGTTLASYNATNPVTAQTGDTITAINANSNESCSFPRPNGSTPGTDDLEASIGGTVGAGATSPLPATGCIDIARSSAPPNAPGTAPADGSYTGANAIQFVPFAEDAITGAYGPAAGGTTFTAQSNDAAGDTLSVMTQTTALPAAGVNDLSVANLSTLYSSCQEVTTANGQEFWPLGDTTAGQTTKPANAVQIDLYIPQEGSGTEKFWATTLGFTYNNPPACVFTTIQAGPLSVNATDNPNHIVFTDEEHDGTNVATDPNGYAPFSIAQWISQSNGHNDRRHGAQLTSILNAATPAVQEAPTKLVNGITEINPSFPITRFVFSVVSLARLTNPNDPLDGLLNGSSSFLCQDTGQILSYGFLPMNNTNTPGNTCGEITAAYEAAP